MLRVLLEQLVSFLLEFLKLLFVDFLFRPEFLVQDCGFGIKILVHGDKFRVFLVKFLIFFGQLCYKSVFFSDNLTMKLRLFFEVNEFFFVNVFGSFHMLNVLKALRKVFVKSGDFFIKIELIEKKVVIGLSDFFELILNFLDGDLVLGVFVFEELDFSDV